MRNLSRIAVTLSVGLLTAATLPADDINYSGFGGLPAFALASLYMQADEATPPAPDTATPPTSTEPAPAETQAEPAAKKEETPGSYGALKIGPQWFTGGASSSFATGFYAELTYGKYIIGRILSIQGSLGYSYNPNDEVSGANLEAQMFPFLVELRAAIPIAMLEPYIGIGIGGLYGRADVKSPSPTGFEDDVVFAGSGFLGVNLNFRKFYVGLEAKAIVTDHGSDLGTDFDFATVMASVGFRF